MSVLTHGRGQAGFIEDRLEDALAKAELSRRDRALTQELVYGVVRWQATLDWLISRKTAHRTQPARLQTLLRLGLYQMFWLERIPDHAAVSETVALTKQRGLDAQAGFLNAVLRGYARERGPVEGLLESLKSRQPSLGFSHPQWLCDRWQACWGSEKLVRLLISNNTPPPVFARLNTLRADAAQLTARWRSEGVDYRPRSWDWTGADLVFELTKFPPLLELPSFRQGWFYVQDPSTLLAVRELGPQPGETILDLCAAPGGKTTLIAQLMQNRGLLVALDLDPDRLARLKENCDRLGVNCCFKEPTSGQIPAAAANRQFDKVLVDVPCSNTGVLRRRIELRWRLKPKDLVRLPRIQIEILRQAAPRVRPGGALVYSTCSLEPEENRQVVEQFKAEHPHFRLESERQLLPFIDGVDGAYVARLRRQG